MFNVAPYNLSCGQSDCEGTWTGLGEDRLTEGEKGKRKKREKRREKGWKKGKKGEGKKAKKEKEAGPQIFIMHLLGMNPGTNSKFSFI